MWQIFLLMAVLVFSPSCKTIGKAVGNSIDARCIDASYQSGCRFLFQLKDGNVLIPVAFADCECPLTPERAYRLRYEILPDEVFACTAEATPVRITYCEPLGSAVPEGTGGIKPGKPLCAWTQDPYQIPWMEQILGQTDADLVTRFVWQDGGAYYFQSPRGNYLFSCTGEELCKDSPDSTDCLGRFPLEDQYVILVKNN